MYSITQFIFDKIQPFYNSFSLKYIITVALIYISRTVDVTSVSVSISKTHSDFVIHCGHYNGSETYSLADCLNDIKRNMS